MPPKETKLQQRFRAVRIVNTWDLLKKFADAEKKEDIAISYHGRSVGAISVRGCHVWSLTRNLNPKGAWYERGNVIFYGSRVDVQPLALAWGVSYTGTHVDDWVKNPVERNGLILKSVVDKAMAWLKEQETNKK